MKYVLNIILILLFLWLEIAMNNYNYLSMPVMSLDEEIYEVHNIYAENLTTKNFNKYFSDTSKFIAVYPKVNQIYKDKLKNIYYKCHKEFNIVNFTNFYKNILEKNNYKSDLERIDYYGINIEKIKIYSTKTQLNEILEKCLICTT